MDKCTIKSSSINNSSINNSSINNSSINNSSITPLIAVDITPINPFSLSEHYQEKPPAELKQLIELAAEPNNELSDIDKAMGWPVGSTADKLRRYPLLKKLVGEARILAMKTAGLSKVDSYKVYAEAQQATRSVAVGKEGDSMIYEDRPDHEVRVKAADRVLTLFGEKPVGGGGVNVAVGVQVNGVSERERELLEAYKRT